MVKKAPAKAVEEEEESSEEESSEEVSNTPFKTLAHHFILFLVCTGRGGDGCEV